jgi:hypothetical protein
MRRLSSESTKNTYSTLNVTVGTVKKSIAMVACEMRPQERPPCRRRRPTGSAGPLGMYLATVSLLTSWPAGARESQRRGSRERERGDERAEQGRDDREHDWRR